MASLRSVLRRSVLRAAALGGLAACGEVRGAEPTPPSAAASVAVPAAPAPHPLAAVSFPLFTTDVNARCNALRSARDAAGRPTSFLTDAVDWAPSLDAAFARATAEDKPVLLATFVRENGDPHCDV